MFASNKQKEVTTMLTNWPMLRDREWRDWRDWFDGFDRFFRGWFDDDMLMRADMQEKDDKYVLDIDLPGFEKENISITLNDGYLVVFAKMDQADEENKKGRYIRRERRYGEYTRSFYVGDIEEGDIKASFKNGVLRVTFPKEGIRKLQSGKSIKID
jgi:HSP20 family molecular chaperone IbpA